MKLLIIGGYGVFGGRLTELLADVPGLTVLIGGRNIEKAARFCRQLGGTARFLPVIMARDTIIEILLEHRPDIVVDASGPFQFYGGNQYQVIEACISAGVHYLDFADGSDFVLGVSRFDEMAKKAGVYVLSGVSSFPVLTGAVLKEISKDMEIFQVEGGIAPSPFAGIGLNVMRAVISYAGGSVRLIRNGQLATGVGLGESRYFTIAPPGKIPLKNLRFSLVDVPDLQVIPEQFRNIDNIWMGAGPVPELLHRLLNILSKTRSRLGLPAFTRIAPLFYFVLNRMRFGEHRGGMYLKVCGRKNGREAVRSWHLLAEGDDGPYIPSMAIEGLVRKHLVGELPAAGARPASQALSLDDYATLFGTRDINFGFRDQPPCDASLYQRVLQDAYHLLPTQLQRLHDGTGDDIWQGSATVSRGKGVLANLVARIVGFPSEGENIPVSVNIIRQADREIWVRDFNGRKFQSTQQEGDGKNRYLIIERFGPVTVSLALEICDGKLILVPRYWTLFGIPLPSFLIPGGDSYECQDKGLFHFNVTIKAPFVGLIVAYKGWLSLAHDGHNPK